VLCVVVTSPSTLLCFGFTLDDRFSHLEGHGPRIFLLPVSQDSGGLPHFLRALSEGTFTPFAKRRLCSFQDPIDFARRHFLKGFQHLARGWIDGLDIHETSFTNRQDREDGRV
jgi:hypothetical protein